MIVFARHGNTFEAGQTSVWVGARTDLPLTLEGFNQAARVVAYLKDRGLVPNRVVAGPLRRTRDYAAVVADAFRCEVEIDHGLLEIDYGKWEGLNNEAVAEQFGREALDAWDHNLVWPDGAAWGESSKIVEARLRGFFARVTEQTQPVFVCTSNGILRLIRFLIDSTAGAPGKVRTGAICLVEARKNRLKVDLWDHRP